MRKSTTDYADHLNEIYHRKYKTIENLYLYTEVTDYDYKLELQIKDHFPVEVVASFQFSTMDLAREELNNYLLQKHKMSLDEFDLLQHFSEYINQQRNGNKQFGVTRIKHRDN